MKRFSIILFSFFSCCVFLQEAVAQRQASVWYFGNKVGLDFSQTPPAVLYNSAFSSLEGCATMSDANGRVLLYSNGVTVYNRLNKKMKNGDGLMGDNSSTNNVVIVPLPGTDSIYYLFTIGAQNQPEKGFRYSVVDLRLDGGLGEVTLKNVKIEDQCYEKMAAVHHCNKTDIWITIRKWGTKEFHTYLFDYTGLAAAPVISYGDYNPVNPIGTMKFSADGKKMVLANSFDDNVVELLDFDNTTGVLSNPLHFQPETASGPSDELFTKAYGAEFSPSGQLLYIASNTSETVPGTLYQFDISSGNAASILASRKIIASITDWQAGGLQIGPDQKIYFTLGKDTAVSYIDKPDISGPGCNFRYNAIAVNTHPNTYSLYSFPGFIQSYFDPRSFYDFSRSGNCNDRLINFTINKTTGIDSVHWDFGDASGIVTSYNPSHLYTAPGYYDVNLVVYKKDCSGALSENIHHRIWISSLGEFLGKDTGTCSLESFRIGAASVDDALYLWSTGETTDSIITQNFGTYWLTIKQNGCSIADTITIYEKPKPVAKITGMAPVCINKPVILNAANDPSITAYLWNTGSSSSQISVNKAGQYSVTVTGNACVAYDTVTVNWGDCEAFVPSAFTPNKDGRNDLFGVAAGFAAKDFRMQVSDRWGNLVFESFDNTRKWDGTYKGRVLPGGAYIWYIYYVDLKGHQNYMQGTVILIR